MPDPTARRPGTTRQSSGGFPLKCFSRLTRLTRLIRPTVVAAMMAVLIATVDAPRVEPLTCGMTLTRTGGVWIYMPDCSHQSPPSESPSTAPGTPRPGAPSAP